MLRDLGRLPSPPRLASAAFDSSGAGAFFEFDKPTDQGGRASGVPFVCSELLVFSGSEDATCSWVAARLLFADVSEALELVPGVNVTLLPDAIKLQCLMSLTRCECFGFSDGRLAISMQAPDPPLTPIALLEGQTTAAVCEGWSVDSAQSSGGGGRALYYTWNITIVSQRSAGDDDGFPNKSKTNATAVAIEAVSEALRRNNAGDFGLGAFGFTSSELEKLVRANITRFAVRLTLRNFLGFETHSSWFPVAVTEETLPNLVIVGGREQEIARPNTLSIKAHAIATSCDSRPLSERGIEYEWELIELPAESPTALLSTSNDKRIFKLPPFSLEAATRYRLTATVTDNVLGVFVSSSTEVYVQRSTVVAVIAGGASRIVPVGGNIVVSAAQSYDEDVEHETGEAAQLSFRWTCVDTLLQKDDCGNAVVEQFDQETLLFAGSDIGVGTFIFTVNAASQDGRSTTATTTITVVDGDPPSVSVDGVVSRVSVNERVVIYATAEPSSLGATVGSSLAFNSSWRLNEASGTLANGLSLEDIATTVIFRSGRPSFRQHDLVLQPGSLVAGATYSLTLRAYLEGEVVVGFASVAFTVAKPPAAGKLTVSPPVGTALETKFDLRTWNWASEDLPLLYSFKLVALAITSTLRGPTRETELMFSTLPEGDPNVTIVAVAIDNLGGTGNATMSVESSRTKLEGDALANLTLGLLSDAFSLDSNEDVCQAVVASSGAAENFTDLIDILVSSIAKVVNNQDADESLIEQSAVALNSPARNPNSISIESALSSLDSALTLTSASSEFGITATTANAIASTLSAMLETSLFQGSSNSNNQTQQVGNELSTDGSPNISLSNKSASAAVYGATIDNLLASQLVDKVADEAASVLATTNLKTSAQRISRNASDQRSRAMSLSGSKSRASLPDSIASTSNTGEFDVSFSESSINPYATSDAGQAVTSNVYRFGLIQTSSSLQMTRGRRRRLEEEELPPTPSSTESLPASTVRVQVDITVETATISDHSNKSVGANLTCDCGHFGHVNYTCPDGSVLSAECNGLPTISEVFCPRSTIDCSTWDGEKWTREYCTTVSMRDGTICRCSVPLGDAKDYGVEEGVANVAGGYVSILRYVHYSNIPCASYCAAWLSLCAINYRSVDPERALYLIITLAVAFGLTAGLAVLGVQLDNHDRTRKAKKAAGRGLADCQKARASIPNQTECHTCATYTYSSCTVDPRSIKSLSDALSWHDQVVLENTRQGRLVSSNAQRGEDDDAPNGISARTQSMSERIPAIISKSARRYSLALRYEHPLASWYCVYSESLPRSTRSLAVGFELLIFMFSLCVEQLLMYPNPSPTCENRTKEAHCVIPKAGFWRNHEDVCEWKNCKCQLFVPNEYGSSDPLRFALLAMVLVITLPFLRLFEFAFKNYLCAPIPAELRRLFPRRVLLYARQSLYTQDGGGPNAADGAAAHGRCRMVEPSGNFDAGNGKDEEEECVSRGIILCFDEANTGRNDDGIVCQRVNMPHISEGDGVSNGRPRGKFLRDAAGDSGAISAAVSRHEIRGAVAQNDGIDQFYQLEESAIASARTEDENAKQHEMQNNVPHLGTRCWLPNRDDEPCFKTAAKISTVKHLRTKVQSPIPVISSSGGGAETKEKEVSVFSAGVDEGDNISNEQAARAYGTDDRETEVAEVTETQISLALCRESVETNVELTHKIGKEDHFSEDSDQVAGVSPHTLCTAGADPSSSWFPNSTYAGCQMDQSYWNMDKASVVDDAFFAAVEAAYKSYRHELDIKFGFFSRAIIALDAVVSKASIHVYSTLRSMPTESLHLKAQVLAPIVAKIVLEQLRELDEIHDALRHRGRHGKRAARLVKKLGGHLRTRWRFVGSFKSFLRNVELIMAQELATASKWQKEIEILRSKITSDAEYKKAVVAKLRQFDRMTGMTNVERLVFKACVDRLDFDIDAPDEAPPLGAYLFSWFATFVSACAMGYVLVAMGSSLGKKQSALWLFNMAVAYFFTFCIIVPVEIFFFFVWIPDLILDRLFTNVPGDSEKMPFRLQTPYALRFLLESMPGLKELDPENVRFLVHGGRHEGYHQCEDREEYMTSVMSRIPAIFHYETWRPPLDTRAIITFVGLFSCLPHDIQVVIFEEIFAFSPALSAILGTHVLRLTPSRLQTPVVLIFTLLIVFFAFVALGLFRRVVRMTWMQVKRGKISKKIRHRYYPFG